MLVPHLAPAFDRWTAHAGFYFLPWILLAVSALLGLCFSQSRIAYGSVVIAAALYGVDAATFGPRPAADATVVRGLAVMLVPSVTVALYHLGERGLFTVHGALRFAVTAAVGMLFVAAAHQPALLAVLAGVARHGSAGPLEARYLVAAIPIACVPLFLTPKTNESPLLGLLLGVAVLHLLVGLCFDSPVWGGHDARGVLLLFGAGTGVALNWAVLESAWRHANLDELTQLPGRRAMKQHLARLGPDFTVAILDIDHFKRINDRYGHDTGDQVLRFVAAFLQKHAPGRTYRFGGEEFVVICEGAEHEAHADLLEEVRRDIGRQPFRLRGAARPRERPDDPDPEQRRRAKRVVVTASVGVSGTDDGTLPPADVLKAADEALYRAKKGGRDRMSRKHMGR